MMLYTLKTTSHPYKAGLVGNTNPLVVEYVSERNGVVSADAIRYVRGIPERVAMEFSSDNFYRDYDLLTIEKIFEMFDM